MKNQFADTEENVSDEQLKHVTGGARVNPPFHAVADHVLDPGDLQDIAAVHGRGPDGRPAWAIESIRFSAPVTLDADAYGSNTVPANIQAIEVFSNGEIVAVADNPSKPGVLYCLGDDTWGENVDQISQEIIDAATAAGDQVSVKGPPLLHVSLPDQE